MLVFASYFIAPQPLDLVFTPAEVLAVVVALLAGCAQGPLLSPPSPAPLLHDTLFGHPARPTDAELAWAREAVPRLMAGVISSVRTQMTQP